MKIDFYYTKATGISKDADEQLKAAIEATDLGPEVNYIEVTDSEDARDKKCFGSPTIRVNGMDVEYGEREPDEYQAGVRYYNSPAGWKPYPHAKMIANIILEQAAREKK